MWLKEEWWKLGSEFMAVEANQVLRLSQKDRGFLCTYPGIQVGSVHDSWSCTVPGYIGTALSLCARASCTVGRLGNPQWPPPLTPCDL